MEFFFFDPNTLNNLATKFHEKYVGAQPFPHVAIDNFLPDEIASRILKEFPDPSQITWIDRTHAYSKKLTCEDETRMGPFTRHVISQLNSSIFIRFLESLTGIDGLIPDPYLFGGGLHQIERGGFLSIHADFNYYSKLRLDRRLNLLLYLNKDWKEEYGGYLELWNRDMTRSKKKVLPIFNRCVIFSTTDFSFHGHPDPLTCPESRTRKSLTLYYYSNGRPRIEVSDPHSTQYRRRPGEIMNTQTKITPKTILKKVSPPILVDLWRYVKKKMW